MARSSPPGSTNNCDRKVCSRETSICSKGFPRGEDIVWAKQLIRSPRYDALASSEQVGVLFASADAQYLPELDEKELRNAIDELQKSTASIEKHTQTLRKQQEAVASLLKSNRRSASSRASVNQAQHRIWDVEAKQLTTSVRVGLLCKNVYANFM
jgi:hypothetical protein